MAGGSSPLARGLPFRTRRGWRRRGIIPARAGFTRTARHSPVRSQDHPRSRGVYRHIAQRHSSARRDHPRSRGVYHGTGLTLRYDYWIIPARAGFTKRVSCPRSERSDHPRSRGVYVTNDYLHDAVKGSSPLARGLPRTILRGITLRRIIPARAGFTLGPEARCRALPDHPRSRGVYRSDPVRLRRLPGSSPLARGLLQQRLLRHRVDGIIPARAGFTHLPEDPEDHPRDHPRSRGVYGYTQARMYIQRGSSPLARGLLGSARKCAKSCRIIPARAGFT